MSQRKPFSRIPLDQSVIVYVASGGRPQRKHYKEIKHDIWQVLESCWCTDPNLRPSMVELSRFFSGQVPASPKRSGLPDILMVF
jgi:hypothetical protein